MRIAAVAHRIDPLFITHIPKGITLYLLIAPGAPDTQWLRQLSKRHKIKFFNLRSNQPLQEISDDDLIKNSDITDVLLNLKINAFMTSHRGSPFLARWAAKTGVGLVSTDIKDQLNFENKVWFDSFLAKRSFPKPRSSVQTGVGIRKKLPIVIQEPNSFGSFGTFIAQTEKDWVQLKGSGALSPKKKYLVREFIKGTTYGISVFIDINHVTLSACRIQCFYPHNGSKPLFAGVQWIPSETLGIKAIERINDVFIQLGCIMHASGFFGFANFDFILGVDGEVSILECNPRLSSATPHLFSRLDLTSGIDTGALFLQKFTSTPRKQIAVSGLPKTRFQGALLDVVCQETKAVVQRSRPLGTYHYSSKGITFDSPALADFKAKKRTLFLSNMKPISERAQFEETLATVLSNFPLFDEKGHLSKDGKLIGSFFDPLQVD